MNIDKVEQLAKELKDSEIDEVMLIIAREKVERRYKKIMTSKQEDSLLFRGNE